MLAWLNRISYLPLIIFALLLGLAPFAPEPHLVEKLRMLTAGELSRPLDIFDLFLHASPSILLLIKLGLSRRDDSGAV